MKKTEGILDSFFDVVKVATQTAYDLRGDKPTYDGKSVVVLQIEPIGDDGIVVELVYKENFPLA